MTSLDMTTSGTSSREVTPTKQPTPVAPASATSTRTEELEQALTTRLLGARGPVSVLERKPLVRRSSFPLEELRLRHGGVEERVVWKDLGDDEETGGSIKPDFLRDPEREIAVYRDLLGSADVGAPRYRGAVLDRDGKRRRPERARAWLFLEHVDGVPLWEIGDPDVWRETARRLAKLHASFVRRPPVGCRPLLVWIELAFRWLDRFTDAKAWLAAPREVLDRVGRAGHEAADWIARAPTTLLHGEPYPSNVLVTGGESTQIRPLDWEMAGLGPGLLDLAALVSGSWSEDERDDLVSAYLEALPRRHRPSAREACRGLDACRLLVAIQWSAWSRGWSPPREHAHDWLGTSIELADRWSTGAQAPRASKRRDTTDSRSAPRIRRRSDRP